MSGQDRRFIIEIHREILKELMEIRYYSQIHQLTLHEDKIGFCKKDRKLHASEIYCRSS